MGLKFTQCRMGELAEIAELHKRIIKYFERHEALLHRSYCVIALVDC
jgi:hypothetical protein